MKVGDLVRFDVGEERFKSWGVIIETFNDLWGVAKEARVMWHDGYITHESWTALEIISCK